MVDELFLFLRRANGCSVDHWDFWLVLFVQNQIIFVVFDFLLERLKSKAFLGSPLSLTVVIGRTRFWFLNLSGTANRFCQPQSNQILYGNK
jgi:hypothetical protein